MNLFCLHYGILYYVTRMFKNLVKDKRKITLLILLTNSLLDIVR